MDKFTTLTGVAAPMRIINVDTDMIIPKQYLKTIKRTGLGTGLFSEMRYNEDGDRGANATLTIDLANQEIRGPDGGMIKFDIDSFRKHCLLNGLDDIGLTLEKAPAIESYEKKLAERSW